MTALIETLKKTVTYISSQTRCVPEVGVILGTGLGGLAKEIQTDAVIPYTDIPGFVSSTVEFHEGRLILGTLSGRAVVAMLGRFHYYEGYSMREITFPIRVMRSLGASILIISNAAGGLNPDFSKGDLVLIRDHINLLGDNPLIGVNEQEFGPRFPDMSRPYSPFLNEKLEAIAAREKISLHKGVYAAVAGPNLETRAEYRFFANFADAVGMSTVPEVIVANHVDLPCAAVSVLTDECDPDNLLPARIEDILEIAGKAEEGLIRLFSALIKEL